jgi:hypothetical protein
MVSSPAPRFAPHVSRGVCLMTALVVPLLGLLQGAGCAKVSGGEQGTGGRGGPGSGGTGPSGSGGRGAGGASSGTGGLIMGMSDAGSVCTMFDYKFEPKIPTVMLMVDQSGSMYDCISTTNPEPSCPTIADTSWTKLKEGILPVVRMLEADVRFGFATINGSNPRFMGMCPVLNEVKPALMNYATIAAKYNGLPAAPNTTQNGMKWETPTRQVLEQVGNTLTADTSPGEKFILFVTDGEPDYCGDGNTLCPPDGVVWQLQKLKAANITTIVFGIRTSLDASGMQFPPNVLEAFANAGAGEPTVAPLTMGRTTFAYFDECNGTGAFPDEAPGGWARDLVASGKTAARGVTLGEYSATPGPTKPYTPVITNQTQLVEQLAAALSGVKSCVFDLTAANGDPIVVDLTRLDKVKVMVETTDVPLIVAPATTNGWRMNSQTQLELVGTACDMWRQPANDDVAFDFPCGVITGPS